MSLVLFSRSGKVAVDGFIVRHCFDRGVGNSRPIVDDAQGRSVMIDSGVECYDMRNERLELVHLMLRFGIGIWSHVQCVSEVNSVVVSLPPFGMPHISLEDYEQKLWEQIDAFSLCFVVCLLFWHFGEERIQAFSPL